MLDCSRARTIATCFGVSGNAKTATADPRPPGRAPKPAIIRSASACQSSAKLAERACKCGGSSLRRWKRACWTATVAMPLFYCRAEATRGYWRHGTRHIIARKGHAALGERPDDRASLGGVRGADDADAVCARLPRR